MYKLLQNFTFEICTLLKITNINWPNRSVQRWMSVVRNLEIRNIVLLSTFGLLLKCFCFGFLCKFDVCMTGKNYCIVYLYTQTSQIDCFRHVHKILLWIGSSDFNLLQQERTKTDNLNYETNAVKAQWVGLLAPQTEGWVFESQPRQT